MDIINIRCTLHLREVLDRVFPEINGSLVGIDIQCTHQRPAPQTFFVSISTLCDNPVQDFTLVIVPKTPVPLTSPYSEEVSSQRCGSEGHVGWQRLFRSVIGGGQVSVRPFFCRFGGGPFSVVPANGFWLPSQAQAMLWHPSDPFGRVW